MLFAACRFMPLCGITETLSDVESVRVVHHEETKRIVQFDGTHPGNELYRFQIKMIIKFLGEVGEI